MGSQNDLANVIDKALKILEKYESMAKVFWQFKYVATFGDKDLYSIDSVVMDEYHKQQRAEVEDNQNAIQE